MSGLTSCYTDCRFVNNTKLMELSQEKEGVRTLSEHHLASFSKVPRRPRECRDVPYLILFVIVLVGMGFLIFLCLRNGDVGRYIYGVDSWGNVCGRDDNVPIPGVAYSGMDASARSYLLPLTMVGVKLIGHPVSICVHECPRTFSKCWQLVKEAGYNVTSNDKWICSEDSPDLMLPHDSVMFRCVPKDANKVAVASELDSMADKQARDEIKTLIQSARLSTADVTIDLLGLMASRMELNLFRHFEDILILFAVGSGLALVTYIVLQKVSRRCIVFALMVSSPGCVVVTAYFWIRYMTATWAETGVVGESTPVRGVTLEDKINYQNDLESVLLLVMPYSEWFFPAALFVTLAASATILLLLWHRKKIQLVAGLFKEVRDTVLAFPSIYLQCIISMAISAASLALIVVLVILSYASLRPVSDGKGMVQFVDNEAVPFYILMICQFVGWFWITKFLFACHKAIIAGAVSRWFFQTDEMRLGMWDPLYTIRATVYLISYNLGSIAIGSLILPFFHVIRWALGVIYGISFYFTSRSQRFRELPCLGFYDKKLRRINQEAYVCVALYGDGFLKGAKNTSSNLRTNAEHVSSLHTCCTLCLFLCKLAVALLTAITALTFLWIKYARDCWTADKAVPVAIVSVTAYLISGCFISIYGTTVDTIFMCYCDDIKRNDGSSERPYFSSVKLQDFMWECGQRRALYRVDEPTASWPHETLTVVTPPMPAARPDSSTQTEQVESVTPIEFFDETNAPGPRTYRTMAIVLSDVEEVSEPDGEERPDLVMQPGRDFPLPGQILDPVATPKCAKRQTVLLSPDLSPRESLSDTVVDGTLIGLPSPDLTDDSEKTLFFEINELFLKWGWSLTKQAAPGCVEQSSLDVATRVAADGRDELYVSLV